MSTGINRGRARVDWVLVGFIAVVALVALVNLYSATRDAPVRGMFRSQIIWFGIGGALFLGLSLIDYREWLRVSWLALAAGVLGIVAVHFFGVDRHGARRWLGWGNYGIQPSEFVKVGVILGLARYYHDRASEELSVLALVARVGGLILTVLLIAWQPDLGTAVLTALICISVALLLSRRLWPLLTALGALGVSFLPLWTYVLRDYQRKRILTFWDPSSDPSGAGWHAQQSILAVGSGQITGKGYLHGTQNQLNFLPEHWTDFPFSVWAEEWGFLGSAAVILLYLLLILWAMHVASQARDRYGAAIALGVGALLFWHTFVNIAMVIGLAPVVGVTLPLISYGGSSVLTVFIALGLLGSVSVRRWAH